MLSEIPGLETSYIFFNAHIISELWTHSQKDNIEKERVRNVYDPTVKKKYIFLKNSFRLGTLASFNSILVCNILVV